jgi:hypothetical protein
VYQEKRGKRARDLKEEQEGLKVYHEKQAEEQEIWKKSNNIWSLKDKKGLISHKMPYSYT